MNINIKENLLTLMEMFTKESGRRTKLRVRECTCTTMVQNTRGNGLMITNMG